MEPSPVPLRNKAKIRKRMGTYAHCSSAASASSPISASRRPGKTSGFVGVKLRGKGSICIELRQPLSKMRHTAAYFTSQEQAAMAHDLARALFIDEAAYLELGERKLNFWEERAFVIQFFRDNGMDVFVGKEWDTNMKNRLREVASKALTLMQQRIIDSGLQSGDLPVHFANSRESLASISPAISPAISSGGEESEVEADDSSQTLISPLPDYDCTRSEEAKHATNVLLKVHEPEGELFNNINSSDYKSGDLVTVDTSHSEFPSPGDVLPDLEITFSGVPSPGDHYWESVLWSLSPKE